MNPYLIFGGAVGSILFGYFLKVLWDLITGAWTGNNLMQFIGSLFLTYLIGGITLVLFILSIGVFLYGFIQE